MQTGSQQHADRQSRAPGFWPNIEMPLGNTGPDIATSDGIHVVWE